MNNGTGTVNPASIMFADANQGPFVGTGFLRFTGGKTNAAADQIQFRGMVIEGNRTLQAVSTPAFPSWTWISALGSLSGVSPLQGTLLVT